MSTANNITRLSTLLCFWILIQLPVSAAVLYTQHFNHPQNNSENQRFSVAGVPWSAYHGASATNLTSAGSGSYQVLVGPGRANPNISSTGGYVYTRAENSAVQSTFALMSETLSISDNWTNTGLDVFLYANASHAQFDVRVLVEIGNQWYATSQKVTLIAGDQAKFLNASSENVALHSITQRLEAGAENWVNFNFTAGQTMGLGSAVTSDLSGVITRVGLYTIQPANPSALSMARFDVFRISEAPEPSKGLLMLIGVGLLLSHRRRAA